MSDKLQNHCQYCQSACVKVGKHKNGAQKIRCKNCCKYQLAGYTNQGCLKNTKENSLRLYLNNVGIRAVARLLRISVNTVLNEIRKYKTIKPLLSFKANASYEIDELRTFVGRKKRLRWVAYAIERQSRKVISVAVGRRTNKTLEGVIQTVLKLNPKRIYTDGLKNYRFLIPSYLHKVKQYNIQRIERNNLTVRGQLRRLNRKTLAYSKNESMLLASVKLLFWHNTTNALNF
jgi:insertion element IS1 protein InsB